MKNLDTDIKTTVINKIATQIAKVEEKLEEEQKVPIGESHTIPREEFTQSQSPIDFYKHTPEPKTRNYNDNDTIRASQIDINKSTINADKTPNFNENPKIPKNFTEIDVMEIAKQSSIQHHHYSSDEEFQDEEEFKEGGNYELGISEVPSNISSPEIPYP